MNNFEEPVLPPEDGEGGNRYESTNIDIGQLHEYLKTTIFEDKDAIETALSNAYKMSERIDINDIKGNMTRIFNKKDLEIAKLIQDKEYWGTPLSGKEPEAVLRTRIKTASGETFDLSVFKIFNRNDHFRHEYVLTPVEELEQAG